eukprot:GDKI01015716.1.p1 GENE.GDKI01015716.1~~GDKI01015716.1.p1  ORF type:complete len:251 (-),score=31.71 GDKI01015716.1:51-803(-)
METVGDLRETFESKLNEKLQGYMPVNIRLARTASHTPEQCSVLLQIRQMLEEIETVERVLKLDPKTSIHDLAKSGDCRGVQLFLNVGVGVNSNAKCTPLFSAACGGQTRVVKLLLSRGANVHERNMYNKWTPLHGAAFYGHTDTAKFLLDSGADANALTNSFASDNRNCLHLAGYKAQIKIELAELLLRRGADVHARDCDGGTPLCTAVTRGHEELTTLLLNWGADPAARVMGRPPLGLRWSDEPGCACM